MKKIIILILTIILSTSLYGCETIEYYETDQFKLYIFNGIIYIDGYKEGYHSENLIIEESVIYYNTRTKQNEEGLVGGVNRGAFQNEGLKSITINVTEESFLTDIFSYAIANNEDLTSVTFKDTIVSIGNFVFANASSLTVIDLHDVLYLGNSVFYNCLSLEEIHLGSEIKQIGSLAFENCNDNLVVYIDNPTPPEIGEDIFKGVESFKVMVPEDYLEVYRSANGWSDYASNILPQS
jgi:hypothetical protein